MCYNKFVKKIIIIILILVGIIFLFLVLKRNEGAWICQNGEWVKQGDTLQKKPQQSCEEDRLKDLIRLTTPLSNEEILSPLLIKGEARGSWFFEASFPVVLVNWDGLIIAEGYATAQSDWMTEDFVPFEVVLEFIKPEYSNRGALILQKDNPSGLPENDNALEIPILFR